MTTRQADGTDDRDPRPAPDVQVRARRDVEAVRGVDLARRRRRDLRLPRPERRRQDDDAADAGDAAPADGGRGDGRRRRPARASRSRSASASATCRRAARPTRPRPAAASSSSRAGCTAWTSATPQARAAEVLAALELEAAADRTTSTYSGGMQRRLDVGLGHRPPAGRAVPRRADDRSRPAGRARMWDEIRRLREQRHDGLPDDPLPRGGRRAGRPPGDHRPRPDRRRGHGRRAQAPGRRRRRHARRRRRHRARPRDRPRAAVRPRGERRGRRSSASTSTTARPPCRSSSASSTAPACRPHDRPRTGPSLDDVFLRQTGRSLREEPRHDRRPSPPRPRTTKGTRRCRLVRDTWLIFRRSLWLTLRSPSGSSSG